MKYVAQPHPLNAEPFVVREHGHCKYPWCKDPEFLDGDRDKAVHALVVNTANISITGNMHVRHTTLAHQFDGGVTEYYEDSELTLVVNNLNGMKDFLREPEAKAWVSNLEALVKGLADGEVLILTPAKRTEFRMRVDIWKGRL